MLKELVIICAAAIVGNGPLHIAAENASAGSSSTSVEASTSVKTDQSVVAQDNDAVPFEIFYKSVVPQSVKYLISPSGYEANAAVLKTLPVNVPVASSSVSVQSYGSGNANQPTIFYSGIVASEPAAPENMNILDNNVNNALRIRPYYSVPVAAKILTINRADSNAAGNIYRNNLGPAVRRYFAGPISANTVQSSEAVNTNPSAKSFIYSPNVSPAIVYASNVAPPKQYTVPVASNKVSTESHGAVNVHPPSPYAGQQVRPNLAFTAQSPALVKYSVNHVVKPPVTQYVSTQRVAYAANSAVPVPVASKKITVEAFDSVTAHPPPTPKHSTGPALIKYAPDYSPVAKPVPVPVIYQASSAGANYPTGQQFVAPTDATNVQASIRDQPVLVKIGDGAVKYNPIPLPRVYAESFIEKVYTPIGSTPVSPVSSGNSYAKPVVFSPASEVSRVSFKGIGASYGW